MKYIFAGNFSQYILYTSKHNLNRKTHVYLTDQYTIQGMNLKLDDIIYVGTYYDRLDYKEIMQTIKIRIRNK